MRQRQGPHAHTNRTRDTRVAEPRPAAPGDEWRGEGQRLLPDTPHNDGGPPPGNGPPPPPRHAAPSGHASQGAGAGPPRPHQPHPGHTGRRAPAGRSRGRAAGRGTAPATRNPTQRWRASPRERPPTTPRARSPLRTCKPRGRCWAPTPAPTAPGTHGSRNPNCPPQRTGGRGSSCA